MQTSHSKGMMHTIAESVKADGQLVPTTSLNPTHSLELLQDFGEESTQDCQHRSHVN